jgi:cytochrome P450
MPLDGWTFSNGDHVPHGAICKLPTFALHIDETAYDRPTEFYGFRFVNDKHPESFPSNTFLAFGHGNHSCPGRVMALAMVKCMVIELLTRYEYEEMAERPPDLRLETAIVPNMTQHIRIRRVR